MEITEFVLHSILSHFVSFDLQNNFSFSFSYISDFASWLATTLRLQEAFIMFISSLTTRIIVDLILRIFR